MPEFAAVSELNDDIALRRPTSAPRAISVEIRSTIWRWQRIGNELRRPGVIPSVFFGIVGVPSDRAILWWRDDSDRFSRDAGELLCDCLSVVKACSVSVEPVHAAQTHEPPAVPQSTAGSEPAVTSPFVGSVTTIVCVGTPEAGANSACSMRVPPTRAT